MILLAESGSSKTAWYCKGKSMTTEGLNPFYMSAEDMKPSIAKVLEWSAEIPAEIHFYGTGIANTEMEQKMKATLAAVFGQKPEIFVYSDIVAAIRALHGNQEGIACILGTGSNSCLGYKGEIKFQIPTLGFWLGDEGSGAYFGKKLILDFLHGRLPEELRTVFIEKYPDLNTQTIKTAAYTQPRPNAYFGGFSPFYKEHISHPFIQEAVFEGFDLFFEYYLSKYPRVREMPIGVVGSVGFAFKDILKKVSIKHVIPIETIIASPLEKLVAYHQL